MYAIIAEDGRQYRVEEGQELDIDYRESVAPGDPLEFDRVLAVSSDDGIQLGQPTVAGAKVVAQVIGIQQGPKIVVQKFRRRKTYRRKTGHRQMYTRVKIDAIQLEPVTTAT
jgi:large subunit ribosomal protein L21